MLVKLDLSAVLVPIIKSSQPKNQGKALHIFNFAENVYHQQIVLHIIIAMLLYVYCYIHLRR